MLYQVSLIEFVAPKTIHKKLLFKTVKEEIHSGFMTFVIVM